MTAPNYWIDLFTYSTWQQFLAAGADTPGFRKGSCALAQQIKVGDFLLCYVVHLARWIGVLQVTSPHYEEETPIWQEDTFPCRLKAKLITALTPETAIPLFNLQHQLTIFTAKGDRRAVGNYLRRSPTKLSQADGEALVKALAAAKESPQVYPVAKGKLSTPPEVLTADNLGTVTVPEDQDNATEGLEFSSRAAEISIATATDEPREATAHTEIQWRLLRLGSAMNLDVWVAKNDRSKGYRGEPFVAVKRLKDNLPVKFDEATFRTVELIDVLWLKGNAIVAAFEIESTTSIYSGLLRMSDLLAMQPNLKISMYLVAPEERREKVFSEVNRPTFSRLSPPLSELCRYISFTALRELDGKLGPDVIQYLPPAYIEEQLSESCLLEAI